MRPLKLTMTAFGPYAGVETIDFTKLKGRNIFLITGPTGAGKTTIFDGISFAVYGNASSDDRDGENLRSHFAGEDVLTSVELEFELRGIKYYIKRIPKQLKKRSRGEGTTEQKSEAYLEFGDIRFSGVSAVNEKIGQILGINYDQFRQIIMIPQGEFRKLITADSQDREKILQRIFGTEGFRRVQEKLGDMAKDLFKESKDFGSRIDENIRSIDCGEDEKLIGLINEPAMNKEQIQNETADFVARDSELEKTLNKKVGDIEKKSIEKSKEIFTAQENNKKFKYRDEAEADRAKLEVRLTEFENKKNKLIKARKALNLAGLEDSLEDKIKVVQLKKQETAKADNLVSQSGITWKAAENEYTLQKGKEPLRQKLLQDKAVLLGFEDKVKSLGEKSRSIHKLQQETDALKKTAENIKAGIESDKENLKKLNDELTLSRAAKDKYHEKSTELEKKNKINEEFQSLLEHNQKLSSIRDSCIKERTDFNSAKASYDTIKAGYERLQELFFQGQAGLLSTKLREGEPCPVCGSVHHPEPAKAVEGVPDEEKINYEKDRLSKAQAKYDESNEKYSRLLGEGSAQKEIVEKLKGEVEESYLSQVIPLEKESLTSHVQNILRQLSAEIKRLKSEIGEAEKLKAKENNLVSSIDSTTENIEQKGTEHEKTDGLYRDTFTKLSTENALLASIRKELPKEIDSEDKLSAEIKALEKEFDALKKAYENSDNGYREAQVQHEKAQTLQKSSQDNFIDADNELRALEEKFNLEVKKAGFADGADYKANKLTPEQVDSLDKEINEFNEKLKSAGDSLLKAEKEIEGLKVAQIQELEQQLSDIDNEKELLNKEKREVFARKKRNADILTSLKALKASLEKVEEEYRIVGNLANTARGKNSENITFERYVLAAFFDDIIDAANLRLTKITGNRYEMSRIKEKSKGNAQSGLELEVLDNYTGRSRHVKTLSGGESFKASLSLALGLADVVQCYAGGISLDTMFIDEGFGTLDPESLDSAIQSLIDLQNTGRLVGIISHVPELKERIDARLEIIPSKEGSTTVFKV